jgi:hypothetical protein
MNQGVKQGTRGIIPSEVVQPGVEQELQQDTHGSVDRPSLHTLPAHFVTHIANAWTASDGKLMYIHYVAYPIMPDFLGWTGPGKRFEDVQPEDQPPSTLVRAVIDLTVNVQGLNAVMDVNTRVIEFPSVNPAMIGKESRYVFGSAALQPMGNAPQQVIAVYDTFTQSSACWGRGPLYFPGEPCYAPAVRSTRVPSSHAGVHPELQGETCFWSCGYRHHIPLQPKVCYVLCSKFLGAAQQCCAWNALSILQNIWQAWFRLRDCIVELAKRVYH